MLSKSHHQQIARHKEEQRIALHPESSKGCVHTLIQRLEMRIGDEDSSHALHHIQ